MSRNDLVLPQSGLSLSEEWWRRNEQQPIKVKQKKKLKKGKKRLRHPKIPIKVPFPLRKKSKKWEMMAVVRAKKIFSWVLANFLISHVCVYSVYTYGVLSSMNEYGNHVSWSALWARITKNTDWSNGPLARPFACSLALHYSLRSCAPLRSFVRSLAHFAHSLARGKVDD